MMHDDQQPTPTTHGAIDDDSGDATGAEQVGASPARAERRANPVLIGGAMVAVVALAAIGWVVLSGSDGGAEVDDATPAIADLAFLTEDGTEATLADYRGEPLVVNFFASWCAPCRAEMPDFSQVDTEADGAVRFLGISHDLDESTWRSFITEVDVSFETAFQPEQEIWESLGLFGMPSTAFVTSDGEVVHTWSGVMDAETLRGLIAEHLDVEV